MALCCQEWPFSGVMCPMGLDTTDLRILAALQGKGRLTNVELAGRVALSPSPCLRLGRHKGFGVLGEYLKHGGLFDAHPLTDAL